MLIDLTGQKFGRLTVMALAPKDNRYVSKASRWVCSCDCGKIKTVGAQCLKDGHTRSCGCLSTEVKAKRCTVHGMWYSRPYNIWRNMVARCNNPKNTKYADYGGRGIAVCEEWLDAKAFLKWALGNGYRDDLTIDRIDNNGNYEPSNCRWTTRAAQLRNHRRNVILSYGDKRMCINDWAKEVGINVNTLKNRLNYGWPVREVLTVTPKSIRHKKGDIVTRTDDVLRVEIK